MTPEITSAHNELAAELLKLRAELNSRKLSMTPATHAALYSRLTAVNAALSALYYEIRTRGGGHVGR